MKDISDERHLEDFLPAGFDPHQAMRILTDYLRNIEAAFEELKKSSYSDRRQLESDLRTLTKVRDDQKQEIERLTADLMELTNTIEEQESLLSTANQKVANYETQFKKLHRETSDLRGKLTQQENDAAFFKQEMERAVQEAEAAAQTVVSANNRLDDLERKLAVERDVAATNEKEGRRLTLALSESHGKILLTERKMEEMIIKYNEEIKRLTERSNADAQHEVNLLKKRVRSSVSPEMRDLEKLMVDKLSIETASNFKALLSRFVSKLEQAGLELKP